MSFKIAPAQPSDFLDLARIAVTAMSVDLLHRVIYPSSNALDASPQESKILAELQQQHAAGAWIAKATQPKPSPNGDEIVGWALLRDVPANWAEQSKAPIAQTQPPASAAAASVSTNTAFVRHLGGQIGPLYRRFMEGKRHLYLKFLMTRPDMQRKGVGKSLLQQAFRELGADQLPVWVITQAGGRDMYLKSGFQNIETIDVNMADFMGEHRGFGMHRNWCMIRDPTSVAL